MFNAQFDLSRPRTDFGGFLVCCQIGHPHLNDVENNSVAISLMLSLENAQIDWTKREKKKLCTCSTLFSNQQKKQLCTCKFYAYFQSFPKNARVVRALAITNCLSLQGKSQVCFDICGGIERASPHGHRPRLQFRQNF